MGKKKSDRKKVPAPQVEPRREKTPEPIKEQKKVGGIICPHCKSNFILGDNELPKCKVCGVELFECSECGTIIDETMRECPTCHALFMGIERGEKNTGMLIVCPSCNFELSENNLNYVCSMCGKTFCDKCLGHHIPPDQNRLEARITYQYKFKDSTYWQNTITKMQWSLPAPLCPDCYEKEFPTGIQKLRNLIKTWKDDQMREMMIKIVREEFPQADFVDKMKLVESAHAFLRTLDKK